MCSTEIKITKAPTSRSSRSSPRVHSRWRAKVAMVAAVGLWLPSSLIMVGRISPQFWTTDAYKAEKAMALIAPRSLTTVESNKSPSAMAPHIDGETRSFLDTKLLFRGKDVVADRVSRLTSITAVTQMDISPKTMQRLTDLASRWVEGYISVAVYIRGNDKASSVMRAEDLERFLSEKASLLHRSIIHLVTDARTENATHPEIFYPINILRNTAMEHAPTERVLLLDVDFVPSVGAHSQLMAHMPSFAREDELIALILPAFERRLVEGREDPISSAVALGLPSSKDDLLTAMKTHPDEYTTFHPYSKGHRATDYEKWYSAAEPYRINYTDTFEPYFVIEKVSAAPPFWEHFSGYGYNKISWVNEIALSGYTFKVAPDSFLVHINHNYHKEKYRWSRPEMKEEYRLNFNAYVRGKYGKSVWHKKEILWKELPDKARAAASLLGYDKRSWDAKKDAPAKGKAVLSLDETAAIEMLGLQKHFSYYVASVSGGHGVSKSEKEHFASLLRFENSSVICRRYTPYCKRKQARKHSGILMWSRIWRIGGFWLSMLGFICLGIGIYFERGDARRDVYSKKDGSGKYLAVGDYQRNCAPRSSRILGKILSYWTESKLEPFTEPILTFKTFIAVLLFLELDLLAESEKGGSLLETPEVIELKREYPKRRRYVFPWAELLMPKLSEGNVDVWVQRLQQVRTILVLAWFIFLLLPKRHAYIGGLTYAIGATLYVYLGAIGLMYSGAHGNQAAMLFIFSAILAVPFLEKKCVNHWLRKMLYMAALNPVYLFAGINKVQYKGIKSNLSGAWLHRLFIEKKGKRKVIMKGVSEYIIDHPTLSRLMSWGNIFVEIVLPICFMFKTHVRGWQILYSVTIGFFHLSIYFLMGPNFSKHCLLLVLATDPFGYMKRYRGHGVLARQNREEAPREAHNSHVGDWLRTGWALIVLAGWWYVQFNQDYFHFFEEKAQRKHVDPLFPWPAMVMMAKPEDTNFFASAMLTAASAFLQVFLMVK